MSHRHHTRTHTTHHTPHMHTQNPKRKRRLAVTADQLSCALFGIANTVTALFFAIEKTTKVGAPCLPLTPGQSWAVYSSKACLDFFPGRSPSCPLGPLKRTAWKRACTGRPHAPPPRRPTKHGEQPTRHHCRCPPLPSARLDFRPPPTPASLCRGWWRGGSCSAPRGSTWQSMW